jgi:hypothetical protein
VARPLTLLPLPIPYLSLPFAPNRNWETLRLLLSNLRWWLEEYK